MSTKSLINFLLIVLNLTLVPIPVGYVAWWLKGDILTPYILIAAVAALLLAVILICVIIICICRRKRRQDKCK